MVVKKVMRWPQWAPKAKSREKRVYQIYLTVTGLDGLFPPLFFEGDKMAVRIIRRTKKRKDQIRVTREMAGRATTGAVGFSEDGNGIRFFCCFGESGSGLDSDCEEIQDEAKKGTKLEELVTESVNLADWLRASQSMKQNRTVERNKSQVQVQRKQLPISLVKDGLSTEAMLYVNVSFEEMQSSDKASETLFPMANEKTIEEEETTDNSYTFEPDKLELGKLLALADETEKVAEYKSRIRTGGTSSSSSSASSSPEQFSKRSFLSWGKKSKIAHKSYDGKERESEETQLSSNSSPSKEFQGSGKEEDPIGSWESKEFISRDRQTKLKSQTFFASIDQRHETAGGESACTALVAVIADALHRKGAYTPTRSEFDALIKEGSLEWQILCSDESYINRFPNKHFDLDTILEAKIRPISVSSEKSFVGFFQPESFESLHGAMSFDSILNEIITGDVGREPRIYIVSWNDHFFVLKVESDAYYIMDTLGERLFEGCTKAYILKFDDSTEMYKVSENNEEDGDELICSGKECCREFIKRFFAAIPLKEELEVEEKRRENGNTVLHQRLQIEFHLTAASSKAIVTGDIDW